MLRILDITSPDINNGLGVRVTLWVSGCGHHCKGCHNKWTWNYEQGKPLDDSMYVSLKEILDKEYISGLTISGGDPLFQRDENLAELLRLIEWFRSNYPTKNIWLYTGYDIDTLSRDGMEYKVACACDIVVDGKFELEKRDIMLAFRGSSNQRVIDMHKYLDGDSDFVLNDEIDK